MHRQSEVGLLVFRIESPSDQCNAASKESIEHVEPVIPNHKSPPLTPILLFRTDNRREVTTMKRESAFHRWQHSSFQANCKFLTLKRFGMTSLTGAVHPRLHQLSFRTDRRREATTMKEESASSVRMCVESKNCRFLTAKAFRNDMALISELLDSRPRPAHEALRLAREGPESSRDCARGVRRFLSSLARPDGRGARPHTVIGGARLVLLLQQCGWELETKS